MLKEALQFLVGLKDNKTYEIGGKTYSDHDLHIIEEKPNYRRSIEFGSLDSIVKMIKTELPDYTDGTEPIFIRIKDHLNVEVFTRPDGREVRTWPYSATCIDASFRDGWRDQQSAIIEIRSRFIPTEGSEYLLDLISRINNEQGVHTADNGVSQTVITRQGVALSSQEAIRPRISLQPFRTFREVPQPESEFILRLSDDGKVGLFEADGGIWKMEAKDNIKNYLETYLEDEVNAGTAVIMV